MTKPNDKSPLDKLTQKQNIEVEAIYKKICNHAPLYRDLKRVAGICPGTPDPDSFIRETIADLLFSETIKPTISAEKLKAMPMNGFCDDPKRIKLLQEAVRDNGTEEFTDFAKSDAGGMIMQRMMMLAGTHEKSFTDNLASKKGKGGGQSR